MKELKVIGIDFDFIDIASIRLVGIEITLIKLIKKGDISIS